MADGELADDDLRPVTTVDALVHGGDLTLDLSTELAQLAPFGLGNPGVTLLLAGCEIADLGAVGEGKHLKFRVRENGRDSGSAIAFRFGPQLDRLRRVGHYDVAFRLEENRWNGTVAPQLNVRQVFDSDEHYLERREWLKAEWLQGAEKREPEAAAIFAELALGEGRREAAPARIGALPGDPRRARARQGRLTRVPFGSCESSSR